MSRSVATDLSITASEQFESSHRSGRRHRFIELSRRLCSIRSAARRRCVVSRTETGRTSASRWHRRSGLVHRRFASDPARTVHRPRRSKVVGRRSRTVRSGRGEPWIASSRDGQERWSKGGGEKGRGTGPCIRRPTPDLLRVVFVPAECRASPPFILWWGRACPVHRAFFTSAPRLALARRAFDHYAPLPVALFTRALDVRSSRPAPAVASVTAESAAPALDRAARRPCGGSPRGSAS